MESVYNVTPTIDEPRNVLISNDEQLTKKRKAGRPFGGKLIHKGHFFHRQKPIVETRSEPYDGSSSLNHSGDMESVYNVTPTIDEPRNVKGHFFHRQKPIVETRSEPYDGSSSLNHSGDMESVYNVTPTIDEPRNVKGHFFHRQKPIVGHHCDDSVIFIKGAPSIDGRTILKNRNGVSYIGQAWDLLSLKRKAAVIEKEVCHV